MQENRDVPDQIIAKQSQNLRNNDFLNGCLYYELMTGVLIIGMRDLNMTDGTAILDRQSKQSISSGKSRTSIVLEQIREDILSCHFLPGEKLQISALCNKYYVGSSPVREALSRLVSEGLVDTIIQKGFRVSKISLAEFKDVASTRVKIEIMAMKKAIEDGDDVWESEVVAAFYRLSKLETQFENKSVEFSLWEKRNKDFHASILNGCSSNALLSIHEMLYKKMARYRRLWLHLSKEIEGEIMRENNNEHKEIMDAVLEKSPEKASAIYERHLFKSISAIEHAVINGNLAKEIFT